MKLTEIIALSSEKITEAKRTRRLNAITREIGAKEKEMVDNLEVLQDRYDALLLTVRDDEFSAKAFVAEFDTLTKGIELAQEVLGIHKDAVKEII